MGDFGGVGSRRRLNRRDGSWVCDSERCGLSILCSDRAELTGVCALGWEELCLYLI
uniref:Uncharacterized protein n=1 Tax=Arundo donax TaxID=35708 RepID=A0A0A9TR24_ARUDO